MLLAAARRKLKNWWICFCCRLIPFCLIESAYIRMTPDSPCSYRFRMTREVSW